MAARSLQQCCDRLVKRQDDVGDAADLRRDLTDARELICGAADLLVRANDATFRAEATLIHAVTEIWRHVESAAGRVEEPHHHA